MSFLKAKVKTIFCNIENIEPLLTKGLEKLLLLDKIYVNRTSKEQRKIISLMYIEKVAFDKYLLYTPGINEAILLKWSINKS
jgi:hypothetical protein